MFHITRHFSMSSSHCVFALFPVSQSSSLFVLQCSLLIGNGVPKILHSLLYRLFNVSQLIMFALDQSGLRFSIKVERKRRVLISRKEPILIQLCWTQGDYQPLGGIIIFLNHYKLKESEEEKYLNCLKAVSQENEIFSLSQIFFSVTRRKLAHRMDDEDNWRMRDNQDLIKQPHHPLRGQVSRSSSSLKQTNMTRSTSSSRWSRLPWPGLSPMLSSYQAIFIIFSILIRPSLEGKKECSTILIMTNIISASFYGSSYISLPLTDAKSSTDISFKFRTSRPESLLFLAAGRTDYCLIMLQQGILKVRTHQYDKPREGFKKAMIIYRMVIVEGCCDQLTSSSLHTYIIIG